MRSIKFRIWESDKGRWLLDYKNVTAPLGTLSEWASIKKFVPMQYTGLKDNNGVEIYEGDMLAITDEYTEAVTDDGEGPQVAFNHIGEVRHDDYGRFLVYLQKPEYAESGILDAGESYDFWNIRDELGDNVMKVIGNIYENPDLLTKGDN